MTLTKKKTNMAAKLNAESYARISAPDYIVNWIKDGVQIPFDREPSKCFYPNRIKNSREERFIDE